MILTIAIFLAHLIQIPDHVNAKNGIAVSGYDVVSYYDEEGPKKGSSEFTSQYNGVTYQFDSQFNKQKFDKNPIQYIPEYGGWCAYAMGASGDKVKVDPDTYKIIDKKLYLFYNFWGNNTLEPWNEDEQSLKNKADQNWKDLIGSN